MMLLHFLKNLWRVRNLSRRSLVDPCVLLEKCICHNYFDIVPKSQLDSLLCSNSRGTVNLCIIAVFFFDKLGQVAGSLRSLRVGLKQLSCLAFKIANVKNVFLPLGVFIRLPIRIKFNRHDGLVLGCSPYLPSAKLFKKIADTKTLDLSSTLE